MPSQLTHADLVALLERMRDVIWTEGEYALSLHDVNATIDALKSGAVVLVNPEEVASRIQSGIIDYIEKHGKPLQSREPG